MIPLLKFISIHKYHALSLILLVCGCVLFGSLIFSDNLWLDEIYTLAEVNASYSSLIQIIFVAIFLNVFNWNKVIVYALAILIGLPISFVLVKFFAFGRRCVKD